MLLEGLLAAERSRCGTRPDIRALTCRHQAVLVLRWFLSVDGTLIDGDRNRTPGPTPGVDLWRSGKHDNHGRNVQVVTAPAGWPPWTSDMRPGREHDTTARCDRAAGRCGQHSRTEPSTVTPDKWTCKGRHRIAGIIRLLMAEPG